eukprot:SAG11_NODE_4641_length_1824_cov_1.761739_2_plen_56_part_00
MVIHAGGGAAAPIVGFGFKVRGRRRSLSKLRSKYVLAAETEAEYHAWISALSAAG